MTLAWKKWGKAGMMQEAVARTGRMRRGTAAALSALAAARHDFLAGMTVAAISLPQSMGYALIAGVDPRFGLYTAIVFTAVAGALGSSRHLVNGPTGAVSLVVFGALAYFDPEAKLDSYEAMFLLSVMMGVVQIAIAVTRLGDVTRYISESVVTGFITGAALLTIIGQVANALGVKAQGTGHQHVLHRLYLTLTQPVPFNMKAVAISGSAVVLAIVLRKLVRRFSLPQIDMLAAVIALSSLAYFAGWSQGAPGTNPEIPLIEPVPPALPAPHIPEIKFEWLLDLSSSAFAIGLLGLLEALAIAKAIAHKSRQQLDYNRQCLAEGVGNLIGGFFRCMPGAGSLSRTAINYQAGAKTQFAGVFAACFVAIAVLLLAPLMAYIPKAALAGLLIVAAARLIDVERLHFIATASLYDAALVLVTALAALVAGVEFAILIGASLSIVWYIRRAAQLKAQELIVAPEHVVRARIASDPPPQGVLIYDFEGDLFFGAAPEFERFLQKAADEALASNISYLVLRLKRVRNPDAVALEVLDVFLRETREQGLTVLLAGLRPDLLAALGRIGLTQRHSFDLIFPEEERDYSATLHAVRNAYALAARKARGPEARCWPDLSDVQLAYYLI
jgi:sulfate permease, SulP family